MLFSVTLITIKRTPFSPVPIAFIDAQMCRKWREIDRTNRCEISKYCKIGFSSIKKNKNGIFSIKLLPIIYDLWHIGRSSLFSTLYIIDEVCILGKIQRNYYYSLITWWTSRQRININAMIIFSYLFHSIKEHRLVNRNFCSVLACASGNWNISIEIKNCAYGPYAAHVCLLCYIQYYIFSL